jgi:hypothetical protein
VCLSSIRVEAASAAGENSAVHNNIVVRYVLIGKIESIMSRIENLKNNQVDALDDTVDEIKFI